MAHRLVVPPNPEAVLVPELRGADEKLDWLDVYVLDPAVPHPLPQAEPPVLPHPVPHVFPHPVPHPGLDPHHPV